MIRALPYGPYSAPIPEPAGVSWQPMVTEDKPIPFSAVSAELREALDEGRRARPDGWRWAEGRRS